MGDATSYYVGGESGGPITIAAQATKTFDAYTGGKTTGVIGDVVIADTQAGIIAEAIGVVAPNGARGELFSTSLSSKLHRAVADTPFCVRCYRM